MNLRSNIFYMYLNQIVLLILPFITAPYIARVLGAENLGKFAYSNTIANYFVIVAMLGIKTYSNRRLPQCLDDTECQRVFSNIYFIQIAATIVMLAAYSFYLSFVAVNYHIAIIQMLMIVACLFDLTWVLLAIDKFKVFAQINVITKILSVVMIFALVKTADDLIIYTWITTITILSTQCITAFYALRTMRLSWPDENGLAAAIRPALLLFVPIIATNIYKVTDKIWLGHYNSMQAVAFYDNAKKVLGFPEGLFIALTMVMLPKISELVSNRQHHLAGQYCSNTLEFSMLISCGCAWGIAAIAPEFAVLYFGAEFAVCGQYIQMLSPILMLIAWSSVVRTTYIIPYAQDKIYVRAVILGAVVNLVLNAITIKKYAIVGAIVASSAAEFIIAIYQSIQIRHRYRFADNLLNLSVYILLGAVMFASIRQLLLPKLAAYAYIIQVAAGIAAGSVMYLISTIWYLYYRQHPLYVLLLYQLKKAACKI